MAANVTSLVLEDMIGLAANTTTATNASASNSTSNGTNSTSDSYLNSVSDLIPATIKTYYIIFGILFFSVLVIIVDLWCIVKPNSITIDPPYYLELSDKEKDLAKKMEERALREKQGVDKKSS